MPTNTTDTTIYPHIVYLTDAETQQVFVPADSIPPEPPDPVAEPSVSIKLNGQEYLFNALDGEILDSYYDPEGKFVQECFVCKLPELPGFHAIYRPDTNSIREEWIFEYGDPWIAPPTANLPAYTVTITRTDGTTVAVEAPVGHFWYSRWRWQSSVRPVRKNHNQLANQNLIPYFNTEGLATGNILTVSNYTPMAYCGIPADQGQTGGYPGLGIQTGWQTQYLVRAADESSFRNQGEAAGTFQSHVRDSNTLAPIDIVNGYPSATMYSSSQGSPYIPRGPGVNRTDQGHMPSVAYLPFLLTGDPYYLEECQFWANHNMLTLPARSRFMVAGRYLAWPARAIFECYLATPETIPSWLLGKSYWKYWLDVCKGYITDRMLNTSDPYYYVFHTIPDGGPSTDRDPNKTGDHVWQQNMLELVAAWIATTQDDWIEPAEWLLHNGVARASSTSGWTRARPSSYHIRLQHASVLREAMTSTSTEIRLQYKQNFQPGQKVTIDNETFTLKSVTPDGLDWTFNPRTKPAGHAIKAPVFGNKCVSWKEAADVCILTYGWTDVSDNDHLSPQTTDLTYPSYQRAALAQAIHAGLAVPGLDEAYNFLDNEIRRLVSTKKLPVGDNWCVMPNVTRARSRIHRSNVSDPQHNTAMSDLIDEFRPTAEVPEEA